MEYHATRAHWLKTMEKIAGPVLERFAADEFHAVFPFDFHAQRRDFAMLEALGRTLTGIAPWLECEGLSGEEAQLQARYCALAVAAIGNAVNPAAKDYVNFSRGSQPLVDAAFLAHALVRAPRQLAAALPEETRVRLIREFKRTREIVAYRSNWMLFTAMVEAGLKLLGEREINTSFVWAVFGQFEDWYKGDGVYGDGPAFHWDYYNSFVIHPMFVDLLRSFSDREAAFGAEAYARIREREFKRASRYASILERMIGPDGSYPIAGRSICYRFGAFHMLAQAALEHMLEPQLAPSGVRCALSAVIGRVMAHGDNFDSDGWLRPGVCGYQPELAEEYINTGSLYLCCAVFLPLGLAPEDAFWSIPDTGWTGLNVFGGKHAKIDHAISG